MLNDLRYSLRSLARNASYTAIAVLTLALGICGNIVIFTFYNALHLRPLPFPDARRLVDLDETAPRWNLEYTGLNYADFDGWRANNRSFQGMAVYNIRDFDWSNQGNIERVRGARVTHDMVAVLGIAPVLGRPFSPDEDRPGGAKVVLLGHRFWQRQFGGGNVLGQTLMLDREAFTIAGVLPRDNADLLGAEFWVPMAKSAEPRDGWYLRGIGRLKSDVTLGMAREDLLGVHRSLVENRRANENTYPRLTPLNERLFGDTRLVILVLQGAVGLVLLIACGNVAALMLARGLARYRELGIRVSLGGTPWRIAQLIGIESLVLSSAGGLVGLFMGYWGVQALLVSLGDRAPRWLRIDVDGRVLLFTLLMVLLAALLGALPVIRSVVYANLQGVLQSSARQSTSPGGRRQSLHALVVAEVAFTLILTIQAGLLLQAFRSLQRVDPGFRSDHVLLYEVNLANTKNTQKEALLAFYDDHLERVRALPGVTSASAVSCPPLNGHSGTFFTIENAPPKGPNDPNPVVLQRFVLPGYFETMGISIQAGRAFSEQDGRNPGSLAVMVNQTFAKQAWPNADPLGKRIRNSDQSPWLTVVGVARDIKHYGLDRPMIPGVYHPYAQEPDAHLSVVVRSAVPPASLVPAVRALVRRIDPEIPVYGVVTMEERLAESMWMRKLYSTLIGIFAAIALLMAVGGIYGVFSYAVSQRTRELGIRMALGAQRRAVLWLVLRQGLALAGIGIGCGIVGALATAPLMRNLIYGVSPMDPVTFAGIALLLAFVALFACWLPSRRAMNMDPMTALRQD